MAPFFGLAHRHEMIRHIIPLIQIKEKNRLTKKNAESDAGITLSKDKLNIIPKIGQLRRISLIHPRVIFSNKRSKQ